MPLSVGTRSCPWFGCEVAMSMAGSVVSSPGRSSSGNEEFELARYVHVLAYPVLRQ